MIKYSLLFCLLAIQQFVGCQSLSDSIAGKYVYENWIGGGFSSYGSNNCYSVPPEIEIEQTLLIDSNWNVVKIVDSTFHQIQSLYRPWVCDTLSIGKAVLAGDTLVVTYTQKPICSYFTIQLQDGEASATRYENLETALIEKYSFRRLNNRFFSLLFLNESLGTLEEFEKMEAGME